ncbi:DUF2637 domain-containing protein [Thermomonospora umbrina]|nr:DUF2637 domain-containing protein [Thermomonospora umbrina]
MTVTVLGVAAVAGWVSYWHAVEVVRRYGAEAEPAVYLIPLTIDGMIYASSMSKLWSARHRVKPGRLSRAALLVGIAATLATNLLQGLEHGPLAAVIAAWPAVALVISYELTMWVVRSSREITDRSGTQTGSIGPEANIMAHPEHGKVESADETLPIDPIARRRRATTEAEKIAQHRERLGQARKLDAEHRASRGRHISAEKLAKVMRIGKPQALDLVKTIKQEVAQSADGPSS